MPSRRTQWRHKFKERDPEAYYDWKINDNLKYKYGIGIVWLLWCGDKHRQES